jgi:hypothetical protein
VKAVRAKLFELGSVFGAATASLASAAASICCVGPLALTLLGVQGAILAAGIKPYRGYLLGASFVLLALGHWGIHRRERAFIDGEACSVRVGRWSKRILWTATGLWFAAVALQFAADRYWI